MIPASQAATSSPPTRGATRTTSPATISTTPTAYIAFAALPGMRSLNWLDRYRVQSSVRTLANLSRPNRIGATVKAVRSRTNACKAGWRRTLAEVGRGAGRSADVIVLMLILPLEGRMLGVARRGVLTCDVVQPPKRSRRLAPGG